MISVQKNCGRSAPPQFRMKDTDVLYPSLTVDQSMNFLPACHAPPTFSPMTLYANAEESNIMG